jgi:hypothetical protein
MNQQFGPLLYTILIWALPAIIPITFHEVAHGFWSRVASATTPLCALGGVTFSPPK